MRFFKAIFAVLPCLLFFFIKQGFPFIEQGFPSGDGGLFLAITQAILENNFIPPRSISYGGTLIPFCYPPLGFYIAALSNKIFGGDLLSSMSYLSLLYCSIFLILSVIVSKQLSKSWLMASVTGILISTNYKIFEWLLCPAGITRALAICALLAAISITISSIESFLKSLLVGFLTAICFITHPEFGPGCLYLLILIQFPKPIGLGAKLTFRAIYPFIIGLCIWPVPNLIIQGFGPFEAALSSASFNQALLNTIAFGPQLTLGTRILTILYIIGSLKELLGRRYFFLIWIYSIALISQRMAIPLISLPIFYIITEAIFYSSNRICFTYNAISKKLGCKTQHSLALPNLIAILILVFAISSKLIQKFDAAGLSEQDLYNFQLIEKLTPASSRIAIVSEDPQWERSLITEWMPVLIQRRSLTTVQGTEWLSKAIFTDRQSTFHALIKALEQGKVLEQLRLRKAGEYDYVAIFGKLQTSSSDRGWASHSIIYQSNQLMLLKVAN